MPSVYTLTQTDGRTGRSLTTDAVWPGAAV